MKKLYRIVEVDVDGRECGVPYYSAGKSEKDVREKNDCLTGYHKVNKVSKKETKSIIGKIKRNLDKAKDSYNQLTEFITYAETQEGTEAINSFLDASKLKSISVLGIFIGHFLEKDNKEIKKRLKNYKKYIKENKKEYKRIKL